MSNYCLPKTGDYIHRQYRINNKIANGSMGVVFRATQLSLHRNVAIKFHNVHRTGASPLEAFRRESRITAKFSDHPGIVQVFDAGESEQYGPYYVMEYVDGPSLQQMLDTKTILQPLDVAKCARSLAKTAGYLHGRSTVHQDIKPSNILVQRLPGENRYILCDFGLACSSGIRAHTEIPSVRGGYAVGTPLYMSKKQAYGNTTHPLSDIHAIGMVMLVMLSGCHPYKGMTTQKVIERVAEGGPGSEAIHDLIHSGIPLDLAEVVRRAVTYEDKYTSAKALQEDLERFLAGTELESP